jgi:diguanylate cyclase (GGDEF)-like protein
MGRRIAATLVVCAALPVLAFAAAVIWQPRWALAALPAGLILAAACALAAARHIQRRHLLPLASLRAGLDALLERRFETPKVVGADEPRTLLVSLGRCVLSLEQQLRALEILSEIDRQLLGAEGLEQVLDTILSRVQAVIRCHSVGIALRDGDARGRGRVYLTAAEHADLPVSRVALDEDMLATLSGEAQGLTIARCEDARHSFLIPLKATGAEIFWVWPVIVAERVEAILAVGFRELPLADPHVIRCGADFAARLAMALSKSARDEHLYRQAHYDPLTALPNRLLFRDRLSKELAGAGNDGARGALLYIDLDHFKRVNDSCGHDAGDQLLTVVAQRLRAGIKDGDTVARLGGDEFTVILRNVSDAEAARAVADRIAESLRLPVRIGGRDHHVGASIGITLFPDDGAGIDDLVRNADTAMYRAKDLGRSRIMFFERSMTAKPGVASDSGLQRALRKREFSLFYQPQFAVPNGALAGVEALLRWQTPRDGLRQPEEFVPAAEESGLMIDIGGWVLDAACAQLAVWREQGIAPPRLAVNVSAQQLRHPDFSRTVRRALDKYALPGDLLELELTESVFADETAAAALLRLAQAGIRLTLDDFGTGYASLSNLRQYPISVVKIDRVFLAEVPHNTASATLVETIIVMAHALGKRVVAEGIETSAQLDFLRERRCDLAQGFYLARPLTASAITELLLAQSGAATPELRAIG